MARSISRGVKQELLAITRDRYQAFSREDRSRILDEFTAVASYHHKHGIRLLARSEVGRGKVRAAEGRRMMLRRGGPSLGSIIPPTKLRAEAAIPTKSLPVHLLDGPAADLEQLGQFPLAHSL